MMRYTGTQPSLMRPESQTSSSSAVSSEMSALMDAVRRGVSVKNATLYCTTFPCHMCARHLISAGIKSAVYIEPYPKSMTKDLYRRAVRVDEDRADADRLVFDLFLCVAAALYCVRCGTS